MVFEDEEDKYGFQIKKDEDPNSHLRPSVCACV